MTPVPLNSTQVSWQLSLLSTLAIIHWSFIGQRNCFIHKLIRVLESFEESFQRILTLCRLFPHIHEMKCMPRPDECTTCGTPTDQIKFISCVVTSPWLEPKTKQNNRVLLGSCKAINVMEIHKSKIQWSWLQLSVDGRPLHWSGGSSSSGILFQFASLRPRPLLHECFSSASHYNHHDSHIKFEISPFLL